MVDLFESYPIRDMLIRNRFMRSATTTYYAHEDGTLRDSQIKLYRRLARGGVGLIVKGHLYIMDSGKAHTGMAGISNDNQIPQLKKLTDSVHENNGKIVAQINHAGVNHQPDRAGPSNYEGPEWKARGFSGDEVETIVEAFGDAAERAMQAGFDGVQIHGAHGYLVSQFLSSHLNKRQDKWGGALENRMRFLLEVYDEVRGRVNNSPVLLKLNADDFSPDGFTVKESTQVALKIAENGIDLLEVSGGGIGRDNDLRSNAKHSDPELGELDFAGHAEKIREATRPTPLALVSGFRKLDTMRRVVDMGLADVISLSRPLIREPDLVKNLQAGQREVSCIRCGACSGREVFGKTLLRCYLE